jgi:hypothetical protein
MELSALINQAHFESHGFLFDLQHFLQCILRARQLGLGRLASCAITRQRRFNLVRIV